jgi:hypothetical protein
VFQGHEKLRHKIRHDHGVTYRELGAPASGDLSGPGRGAMGRMEPDTAAQAMETMPQKEENLSKQCIDDVDEMSMECQCFQLKSIYFQCGIVCLRLFVLLNLKERISMELHLLSIHYNLLSIDCPFEPQKKDFN